MSSTYDMDLEPLERFSRNRVYMDAGTAGAMRVLVGPENYVATFDRDDQRAANLLAHHALRCLPDARQPLRALSGGRLRVARHIAYMHPSSRAPLFHVNGDRLDCRRANLTTDPRAVECEPTPLIRLPMGAGPHTDGPTHLSVTPQGDLELGAGRCRTALLDRDQPTLALVLHSRRRWRCVQMGDHWYVRDARSGDYLHQVLAGSANCAHASDDTLDCRRRNLRPEGPADRALLWHSVNEALHGTKKYQ